MMTTMSKSLALKITLF